MARKSTIERTGGVGWDTTELKRLATDLRAANKAASRDLRKGLREAGLLIAEAAKRKIEPFSSRVAGTIGVRTAGAGVEVRAGTEGDPLARLLEVGNSSGAKLVAPSRKKKFRHPVMGDMDAWASQDMHPFLRPAAIEMEPEVQKVITATFLNALRARRIEVEK